MVSTLGWTGIGGGGLVIILLLWWVIRKSRGRLGEEIEEEKDTEQLQEDEIKAEKAQRDERKQCRKLEDLFRNIRAELEQTERGELSEKLGHSFLSIQSMLRILENEKINVKRALVTFKELHASINEFLTHLPEGDKKINKYIIAIKKHQDKFYQDLRKEIIMDRDKKRLLKKIWAEEMDQQTGTGYAKAA